MTLFLKTPYGNTIAYNQIKGNKTGIVFLSGFGSDMQGFTQGVAIWNDNGFKS